MDHSFESGPRVLSLCSGIAYLDLAVGLAFRGARTVCLVEREGYALEVLVQEMEAGRLDAAPIWTDLFTFEPGPWRGAVDLVVAGFPCQPASLAGKRAGVNDERWIWPRIADILEDVAAPYLFLENVPGLLTVSDGEAFQEVLSDLAQMGYDTEYGLFRASDVGATHRRERFFLFARHRRLVDAEGLGNPVIEEVLDREPAVGSTLARADGRTPAGHRAEGVRARIQLDAAGTPYLQPVLLGAGDVGVPEGLGRGEGRPEHAWIEGGPDAAVADGLDGRGPVANAGNDESEEPEGDDFIGEQRPTVGWRELESAGPGTGGGIARRDHAERDAGDRIAAGDSIPGRWPAARGPVADAERGADDRRSDLAFRGSDRGAATAGPGEEPGRGELGDADGAGLPLWGGTGPAGLQRQAAERAGLEVDRGAGRQLADAVGDHRQRLGDARDLAGAAGHTQGEVLQREWRWRAAVDPGAGGMPLFPPGPRSLRWVSVAYYRPDLFPALTPDGRIPESSPFYPFYLAGIRDRQAEQSVCLLAHGRDHDGELGPYMQRCGCPRTDMLRAAGNGVVPHQAALAMLVLASRMGWDRELSQETADAPCGISYEQAQLLAW